MKSLTAILYLLLSLSVVACKEESYVYPSVLTEFIDLKTDENGTASQLITDNGESLRINHREGLDGLSRDSIYRTLSIYLPNEDDAQHVELYQCRLVTSPIPVTAEHFKDDVRTDPIDIQSIWKAGNYINMILLAKVKLWPHFYHFIHQGIQRHTDGKRTLLLQLYHNQNSDETAFTEKVYLSVPLWSYADSLSAGDSIRFRINTFKEGETERTFIY